MPAIGALTPFCITGILQPAMPLVTPFMQFGQDGEGEVIGAKRQAPSNITSTHFVDDREAAKLLKIAAGQMVGTVVAVIMDEGADVSASDCVIRKITIDKDCACTGVPGGEWVVIISWDLIVPIDWA